MRLGSFAILNMICVMAVSCSPDTSDDIKVFPIAEDLGKDVIKSDDTSSFILVHVTDVSSIALSAPRVIYVNDSLYGIHADKSLYFVDRRSGDGGCSQSPCDVTPRPKGRRKVGARTGACTTGQSQAHQSSANG